MLVKNKGTKCYSPFPLVSHWCRIQPSNHTKHMTNASSLKTTYDYIGCDYYGQSIDHLVNSMAHGVTSDPYNETYYDGNQVIILARQGERLYGYLALADGTTVGSAGNFWPNYHKPQNVANRVVPVSKIHEIPADLVGRLGQRGIQQQYRPDVATYLLRLG